MKAYLKVFLKEKFPRIFSSGIYLIYGTKDVMNSITGKNDPLIPPTRLMFDGPRSIGEFRRNGEIFQGYFQDLCGLKPDGHFLDVGSGIGRKAIPLTNYLDENGRYEGFDISEKGIDWCRKNISTKYPNFHFTRVDVYNKYYNPSGAHLAEKFIFPFEDESFDLVFLGSVFTHMLPDEIENYLGEVSRVLKTNGKCLISYFLSDEEVIKLMNANRSEIDFKYEMDNFRTTNLRIPEDVVCYDESYICDLYKKNGLNILRPIHYGSWSGREYYLDYQDMILAEKIR